MRRGRSRWSGWSRNLSISQLFSRLFLTLPLFGVVSFYWEQWSLPSLWLWSFFVMTISSASSPSALTSAENLDIKQVHIQVQRNVTFRGKTVILWAHLLEECAKVRKYPGITGPSRQLVHRGKLLRRRGYQGPKRVAWRRKSALGSDCPNFFLTLPSGRPAS